MEKSNQIKIKFFNTLADLTPVHARRKLSNTQYLPSKYKYLSAEQQKDISIGLTRSELITLKTTLEIEASVYLKNKEICINELKIGHRSRPEYLQALLFLADQKNMSIKTIFNELRDLDSLQLQHILKYKCIPQEAKSYPYVIRRLSFALV